MTHPFSAQYIAMAKAAEEIQAMRVHSPPDRPRFSNYELGDVIIDGDPEYVAFLGDIAFDQEDAQMELDEWSGEPVYPRAWLPRLDQLLGMLGKPSAWHKLRLDIEGDAWSDFPGVDDWHELALAVVMREKFGKAWDGKGWVKT